MQITHSSFADSTLSVRENVVKNILFRISAIFLQYAIFNFCAYVAYLATEYTSFLMFAENYVQRTLFITSRGISRSAIIVLIFTISYTLAGMYDTLLWALDAPGYVTRSKLVNGTTISPFLLQNPSYVSIINDPNHDLDRIDVNETLTSTLFKPGFNFSFPPSSYIRTPEAILPPKPLSTLNGPRIYLDKEGFGVSFGLQLLNWPVDGQLAMCPPTEDTSGTLLLWYCNVPGAEGTLLLSQPAGEPLVWWDEDYNKTAYVAPSRSDNPWASYNTGGDTAVMKQVFTLTKGNRRHTFLQTTLKVSMVTKDEFPEDEIRTMIQRIYAPGNDSDGLALVDIFTQRCMETQQKKLNSSTMGFMSQDKERPYIGWSSTEYFNLVSEFFPTERIVSVLRILDITIELVRSETIPEPVQPAVPCDVWNVNLATGGKVRSNNCYKSSILDSTTPGAMFLGQIDTSAVAIIVDVLGDGTNDTNVVALNHTGENWYTFNRSWVDQLLLSRAFLLSGDASTVNMLVHHNEAAVSYLQILLVLFPFILALAAFTLMLKDKPGYYKNSLFASLITTTHLSSQVKTCETVGYVKRPPNIVLQRTEEHVRIGTEDGAYVVNSNELSKFYHHRGGSAAKIEAEASFIPSPMGDDSPLHSQHRSESYVMSPLTGTTSSPLLSASTRLDNA